jgi:hypothetical protein
MFDKNGFFVNEDGVDSRDIYKAPGGTKSKVDEMMYDEVSQKKKPAKNEKIQEDDEVCKPKNVLSGYIFFTMENRIKLLKQNPDLSVT